MRWTQRIDVARPVMSDTLTVAAGNVTVKGAGLLKVMVSAHLFGTGDEQDAFLAAFLLPSVLGDMFSAAAAPALVPAMLQLRAQENTRAARGLYGSALAATIVTMCLIGTVLALALPLVFGLLASGFDSAKISLSRTLYLLLLPMLPLTGCNVIWRATLNAHGRFAVVALAPAVTPLITLATLLTAAPRSGIFALAIGTLAGCLMEALVLALAVRRLGYGILPSWDGDGPRLRAVLPQFWPLLCGSLLLGCCPLIDNAMAAGLEAGSLSALSFGTKLATVIVSIGPAALGTAALPHLSGMAARGEWERMRSNLRWLAAMVAVVAVPSVAALIAISEPLVRLVFQKGAFTEDATIAVTTVQRYSLLQIPFATISALGFRLAASLRASGVLIPVAFVGVCVTAVGDYLLRLKMGVAGIALAATFSQAAMICTLALVLKGRLRH